MWRHSCHHSGSRKYYKSNSGCVKRLIGVILLLVVLSQTTTSTDIWTCDGGIISPAKRLFLLGQNITLNCSVNDADIKPVRLYFLRGDGVKEVHSELTSPYNNNRTHTINVPVTENDIQTHRRGVGFRCMTELEDGSKICLNHTHVQLDYYPQEVENFTGHVINFNRGMQYNWSLGVNYVNHTGYVHVESRLHQFHRDISRINSSKRSWNGLEPCPHLTSTSCTLNQSEYNNPFGILIRVKVTNTKLDISTTTEFLVDPNDLMLPDKVADLTLQSSTTKRCLSLKWKPPSSSRNFTVKVTYISPCNGSMGIHIVNSTVPRDEGTVIWMNTPVCGLIPYVNYTFSVQVKFIDHHGRERGYWSESVSRWTFTRSDVPDVSPDESSLQYELQGNKAMIYWQPLCLCQLHSPEDEVNYSIRQSVYVTSVRHPYSSTLIDVSKTTAVNVTVRTFNGKGHARENSMITVFPQSMGPDPSELIVQYNVSDVCRTIHVRLHPAINLNFTEICHELVWCMGTKICDPKTGLQSVTLDVGVEDFLLPSNHCYGQYVYGLVTKGRIKSLGHQRGQVRSSGIHWVACEYQLGKVPDEPLNVLVEPNLQPDNGVHVSWVPYDCSKQNTGYITAYTVAYCVNTEKICNCEKQHKRLPNTGSSYTLEDLSVGEHVCIWVRGESLSGSGPFNTEALTHTVTSNNDDWAAVLIGVIFSALSIVLIILVIWKLWPYVREKYNRASRITNVLDPHPRMELEPIDPEAQALMSHNNHHSSLDESDAADMEAQETLLTGYMVYGGEGEYEVVTDDEQNANSGDTVQTSENIYEEIEDYPNINHHEEIVDSDHDNGEHVNPSDHMSESNTHLICSGQSGNGLTFNSDSNIESENLGNKKGILKVNIANLNNDEEIETKPIVEGIDVFENNNKVINKGGELSGINFKDWSLTNVPHDYTKATVEAKTVKTDSLVVNLCDLISVPIDTTDAKHTAENSDLKVDEKSVLFSPQLETKLSNQKEEHRSVNVALTDITLNEHNVSPEQRQHCLEQNRRDRAEKSGTDDELTDCMSQSESSASSEVDTDEVIDDFCPEMMEKSETSHYHSHFIESDSSDFEDIEDSSDEREVDNKSIEQDIGIKGENVIHIEKDLNDNSPIENDLHDNESAASHIENDSKSIEQDIGIKSENVIHIEKDLNNKSPKENDLYDDDSAASHIENDSSFKSDHLNIQGILTKMTNSSNDSVSEDSGKGSLPADNDSSTSLKTNILESLPFKYSGDID